MSVNKTLKVSVVVGGTVGLMVATIFGAIWISHIESRKAAAAYPACQGSHTAHQVVIQNDKVLPQHTDAKRCDRLSITNLDDQDRVIAFGPHEHHVAYDGVTERYLNQNGKFSVTLVQPGNFRFHDHEQDIVQGTFTVTP
jgi:hypothetical protein